jgi:uncharacterized coiled-coil protein SlyX
MTTEDEDTKDFLENVHRRQRLEREAYLTARQTRDSKVDETKVDETKPSEPIVNEKKPRKVVGRSVAIALGIVCILLIAGLGGAMVYYTMTINNENSELSTLKSGIVNITGGISTSNVTALVAQLDARIDEMNLEITDQINTIVTLNANITTLTNEKNQLQTWLDGNETMLSQTQTWLSGNITSLQSQMNNLTNIVNLANSTVWVNDQTISQPHESSTSWTESANYAGYISINVLSSTTNSTYAHVVYSADGVNYDNPISVGTNGTAYFPVLPSSNITVEVGNKNPVNGATETVTITYYY